MNAHAQARERRQILAAARRYRRDGYKVSEPDGSAEKPSFLGDFVPDLIAERDDDKVVIEVKQATSVRGANSLVELAERVSGQPGWRFELIAVPETTRIVMPDLAWIDEEVHHLLVEDFLKPAFIVAFAMIENLVACATVRQGRNPANATLRALVRDLVVRGIIDEDTRRKIDEAAAKRNTIMHATTEPDPTRDEIEALMNLGRDLERDVLAAGLVKAS